MNIVGHGWKTTGTRINKRKCNCGKGHIYTEVLIQESDFPPYDREMELKYEEWTDCPVNCENKKQK